MSQLIPVLNSLLTLGFLLPLWFRVRASRNFHIKSGTCGGGGYIELSTGEDFQDLEGFVNVCQKTGDDKLDSPCYEGFFATREKAASENRQPGQYEERRQKVIGSINYVAPYHGDFSGTTSASYDVRVVLSKDKFDELVTVARLGHLPSAIQIRCPYDTEGLTLHGDGDHKKWDNKAFPQLDVVHVEFSVPLISQAIGREQLTPADQVSTPTRSQVNHLSEKLDRLATAIESGLRSLLWAVLLIGALILILRILR
ncbi:MAG: hypothetical protein A2038_04415 [Deltaproteobacteria bacterium GWA2_57_13]|nr:MAG: hypothetical protein A2038_04415 [Deltaproteobacteria bacterium GWA2_57_13]